MGKFRLSFVMVVVVCEVSKAGARRDDTPGGGEGFIQAHMGWVRVIAQSIENCDLDPAASFDCFLRDQFAIIQVSQSLSATLDEEIASGRGFSMRQLKRGDVKVANGERAGHEPWVWNEVASWPGPGMEGIGKHPP